jgi:hypothetical protein
MKLNLRLVPPQELLVQGHYAFWHETLRNEEAEAEETNTDHHLTLYKDNQIAAWITLCPTNDPDILQLCNRYMAEEEECNVMEEKALAYVEEWARQRGYAKVFVHACEVSVPFYLRAGYRPQGDPFSKGEVLLHKMEKAL